jgi:hypothetical protein
MRLCCGAVIFYVHLAYSFGLMGYVAPDGWVDRGVLKYLREEITFWAPPADWTSPMQEVGHGHIIWSPYFHLEDPFWITTVHVAILVAMALFMVGLWTRVTSVLAWAGAMAYVQRVPTLLFGMDTMGIVALTYMMIAPCGDALSVDRWLLKRRARRRGEPEPPLEPSASATFATRLLQIHFCYIYGASGLSKLLGSAWWNGTALWGTVANSYFAPMNLPWYLAGLTVLAKHRWLWEIAMSAGTAYTLALEIGFPFLVWNRRLRWVMVSAAVFLHTGIGLSMGLVTFSLMMLVLVMAFVPPEAVQAMLNRLQAAWHKAARPPAGGRASPAGELALSRH